MNNKLINEKHSDKIYLIGNAPENIDPKTYKRFTNIESKLIEFGYSISNPINRTKKERLHNGSKNKRIQDLIDATAVYILPNTDINYGIPNLEIKLAIHLDLVIITSIFTLNNNDKSAVKFFLSDPNTHFII